MRVIWIAQAQGQREAIWQFLAERSPDFADRVEARILARAESLIVAPLQGKPVPRSVLRELSIPDVQYVLHYRLGDDAIYIMRVFSTRQNRDEP